MKELVLVPTYQRSAFLAVCLEAIRAAEPDANIHVFPDRGENELEVCDQFSATHHLTWKHTYHGNSANMLEALKWANSQSVFLVHVIEDDAIITPDYFAWARAALLAHPEAFCACGWQYSPQALISDGPDILMPWYLSVCATFPHHSLPSIGQHARPEYYSDMPGYLDRAYPASSHRGTKHYEQDGLVLRVLESQSRRAVWPRRPRALHIGWQGYHMTGPALDGSLAERVQIVKAAIANPSVLARLMSGGPLPHIGYCTECQCPLLMDTTDIRTVCSACFHATWPDLPHTSDSHYYISQ